MENNRQINIITEASGGGGGEIHSNLFYHIISPTNLFRAWRKFRRGKTKKKDILDFEFNLEKNIFQLHENLKNKTYTPDPYVSFFVCDPKRRHIHKATVRDRVVHQALYQVVGCIFEKSFIFDSFSCREDKGTHAGSKRLEKFLRQATQNYSKNCFALKCDVSKFFNSINHNILKSLIRKKIADTNTLWLINTIVDSFNKVEQKGLPLGNVTSQLFGNIYLHQLDFFIKQRLNIKHYVRYCDDFVILSPNEEFLEKTIFGIGKLLKTELNLNLHPRKVSIRKNTLGVDFLGYVLLPHYNVLRTSTKNRIFRKFK